MSAARPTVRRIWRPRASESVSPVAATGERAAVSVRWRALLAMLALVGLALALRLYGVTFGLPYIGYYWDEPAVVNRALQFGGGDLNPHWFYYPAFYLYVLFGMLGSYAVLGMALGHFASIDDFAVQYFVDPTGFYLVARATTAVIGALSVLLVVRLGQRWLGALAGWSAGLILAVSVLHASYSTIAVTDIPQTFFIVAACWPLLNVAERRRWRDYALAGLLIGLGAATKYLAILMVPSLVLAHLAAFRGPAYLVAPRWGIVKHVVAPKLLVGLVAVFIGFMLGSPFNILDAGSVLRDAQALAGERPMLEDHSGRIALLRALPDDVGWPALVAALIGAVVLLRRSPRLGVVLLSFPLIYFLFNMLLPRGLARYLIPLSPFLALMAGCAVASAYDAMRSWRPLRQRQAVAASVLGLTLVVLVAMPLAATLRWKAMIAHEADTRTTALVWLHGTAPAGTTVAVQPLFDKTYQNVPVLTDRAIEQVERDIPATGRFARIRQRVVATLRGRPHYREVQFVYAYDRLRDAGVRYIITSNQNWQSVLDGRVAADRSEARFKRDLDAHARVAGVFAPPTDLQAELPWSSALVFPYLPPTITIYEVVE